MSSNHPAKRSKVDSNLKTPQHKFSSAGEIRQALRNVDQAGLTESLTALRNQLTIRTGESPITPQDERLLLAKQWLEISPGADEVFNLLENRYQTAMTTLSVSVLACLLTLLSSHFIYQDLGQPIIKSLLSSYWLRKLELYLGGSHTDLTLVTVKLLNAISNYSGGREQKALLEAFMWDVKLFNKLLFMRRKGKYADNHDMLAKPDIRTLSLLFILSFVSPSSTTYVKVAFLEQHRDLFISIFRGLNSDPYVVARKVLEVCWMGIWQDLKVKRTLKVGLFNEATLQQIIKLYDRSAQEGLDLEHIPADLVHHFMLAICTHRGVGLCFSDHGWYPRTTEVELDVNDEVTANSRQRGGKIYNKILANLIKTLKVNEDLRQQELALKVLSACPELVAGYWQAVALTLEPRLSSKWLANVAFFGSIISLPVPTDSFFLPSPAASSSSSPALYQPTPPPLANIMENILPSVNMKAHFTKGLQSPSALVQHCTAVGLAKCLIKCEEVLVTFRKIQSVLEEDETNGQWAKRTREIEREIRKRVPEFQVIVAFSQPKPTGQPGNLKDNVLPPSNHSVKASLLSEIAQRLLWLYHRCVPSLVAEARFDVGKSLQTFLDPVHDDQTEDNAVHGLERLRQLHVLRMLGESDQFVWSGKASSSSRSNIYILLKLFIKTQLLSVRNALASLMTHVLSNDILFQHDADELHLWLDSLPTAIRATGVEAPDGALLTDEGESVVSFLDDCMLRCAKTPYRYLEELDALVSATEATQASSSMQVDGADDAVLTGGASARASPLIMTVLEQFAAKTKNRLLSPSDTLALTTYVRKLVVKLLAKQPDLRFAEVVAARFGTTIDEKGLFSTFPVISSAIRREIALLRSCIKQTVAPASATSLLTKTTAVVQNFLQQIESLEIPDSEVLRKTHAYELVDWLRLVEHPLHQSEVERLVLVIERLYPAVLPDFYLQLNPEAGLVWPNLTSNPNASERLAWLHFDWLFLQASSEDLQSPICRELLVKTLNTHHSAVTSYKRHLGLLMHRLRDTGQSDTQHILGLLVEIVQQAKQTLSSTDEQLLKTFVLTECQILCDILCKKDVDETASIELDRLVESLLNPESDADKLLVSAICKQWATALESDFAGMATQQAQLRRSLVWIKFMDRDQIMCTLEQALQADEGFISESSSHLLEEILRSLNRMPLATTSTWLQQHLPDLMSLRRLFPQSVILEGVITNGVNASIPLGHDGHSVSSGFATLSSTIAQAHSRWHCRLSTLPSGLDLLSFIGQEEWSEQLSTAIAGIIYQSSSARHLFWRWLTDGTQIDKFGAGRLAAPLHAFLDSSSSSFYVDLETVSSEEPFTALFKTTASGLFKTTDTRLDRNLFASCCVLMLERLPSKRAEFLRILRKCVASLPVDTMNREVLNMAVILSQKTDVDCSAFIETLIDHGLQWAVRYLSEGPAVQETDSQAINDLITIILSKKHVTAHFAEPVLAAAIRHHLLTADAIDLAAALLSRISLKPVNVNRYLQSVLQHPQLQQVSTISDSRTRAREAVVGVLHSMFHEHPSNTCQPTHIQPLIRLYGGTLSTADRKLFAIFHLFESQRKASTASIFALWCASGSTTSQTCLEAVKNLDPTRVLRTCLNFPVRRSLQVEAEQELLGRPEDSPVYDPVFVLLLFSHAMLEGPPQSALAWLEVFRTNVASLVVRTFSSKDPALRGVALSIMTALWKLMKTADLQEKEHVTYVLDLLRDLLPAPSDEPPIRLASYTTLVLVHALRGIFYPSNFIYPLTARFLLQRPELDPHDVPLLYGMLYSSSEDWKKERGWIIKFIGDGLSSTEDWRVFKRRHTWDLLASLFQSSHSDRLLRHGALEVLANLTCNSQATTSLLLKSSMVQWMEVQLQTVKVDECTAWVKIVENILLVVDAQKMEQATKGEWRAGVVRCLNSLVQGADINLLRISTRAILRLALLPFSPPRNLSEAIAGALRSLETFEETSELLVPSQYYLPSVDPDETSPPHRSLGLHQLPSGDNLRSWGHSVERLWQVVMVREAKDTTWDSLSCRMLVWRSIVREQASPMGEWVRQEVVKSLSTG